MRAYGTTTAARTLTVCRIAVDNEPCNIAVNAMALGLYEKYS